MFQTIIKFASIYGKVIKFIYILNLKFFFITFDSRRPVKWQSKKKIKNFFDLFRILRLV